MNLGRPLDSVAIAALRPIGQWAPLTMWLLASAGTLGPAWLMPSNVLASAWFACWGLFIFACWWRSALRGAVVKYYRQPEVCLRIDDPFRMRTRRIFAIVTLLILTRAPFLGALMLSRPWLDEQAYYIWAVLPADVQPQARPRWRGLVIVRRVEAGPTYVKFELFGGGQVEYRPSPDGQRLECEWSTWRREW